MVPTALFVHNGSPGRFDFLGRALLEKGWRCALINGPAGNELPGMPTIRWQATREPTAGIFDLASHAEADIIRGHAAARCAQQLQASGFQPDIIVGHPGWGEMAFLSAVFPDARQIQLGEYYYLAHGAEVDFDAEFGFPDADQRLRVHAKNAVLAMSLAAADSIVAPTRFQASLLPPAFRSRVSIIHEGIDTSVTRSNALAKFQLQDGRVLDRTTPVVTFINRFFEPMRGVHSFLRALPRVLAALPNVHILMIGSDAAKGYGRRPPSGLTWRQVFLEEVRGDLDMSRVHFTGQVAYDQLLSALSISSAHVYLTYPFVLSWSLLEAMACECLVVGSDTGPVRDVIKPGDNGLLVDFFDHGALASILIEVCQNPERYEPLRRAARQTIINEYDRRSKCEPAWLDLIDRTLSADRRRA